MYTGQLRRGLINSTVPGQCSLRVDAAVFLNLFFDGYHSWKNYFIFFDLLYFVFESAVNLCLRGALNLNNLEWSFILHLQGNLFISWLSMKMLFRLRVTLLSHRGTARWTTLYLNVYFFSLSGWMVQPTDVFWN